MHCTNPDKFYDIETPLISDKNNNNNDQMKILSEEEVVHNPDLVEIDEFSMPQEELEPVNHSQEASAAPTRNTLKLSDLPKPGQMIDCTLWNNEEYKNLKIISRAGKATGLNKYFLNVVQEGVARPFCLDFENKVSSWEIAKESENKEEVSETFLLSPSNPLVVLARQNELST